MAFGQPRQSDLLANLDFTGQGFPHDLLIRLAPELDVDEGFTMKGAN